MRRILTALLVLAVLGGAGAGLWWMFGRGEEEDLSLQGWVEGNLVFMAPEEGGRIDRLMVEAGDAVREGELLFALDATVQEAQRNEARARLGQAEAQLANLKAAQQRPEQIAVLQAQVARARAALELSRNEFERQRTLFERGIAAKAQLDNAKAAFDRDRAALEEAQRQITAAEMTGREAEIAAAEAAVRAAAAALAQAETRLAKRRVVAPAAARVQDVFFRPGEVVNAGQPVLALLPPANLRIRFFAPEPRLATLSLGQRVAIACDSCPAGLTGRISFLSREAEFTPPVIFSDKERAKLVFRVEAKPDGDATLPLGLPVAVTPLDAAPVAAVQP